MDEVPSTEELVVELSVEVAVDEVEPMGVTTDVSDVDKEDVDIKSDSARLLVEVDVANGCGSDDNVAADVAEEPDSAAVEEGAADGLDPVAVKKTGSDVSNEIGSDVDKTNASRPDPRSYEAVKMVATWEVEVELGPKLNAGVEEE